MQLLTQPIAVREITLDELWREAEEFGFIRIWTHTDYGDNRRTDYAVTIKGRIGNAKIELERRNSSLHGAFADVINEARNLGMGHSA